MSPKRKSDSSESVKPLKKVKPAAPVKLTRVQWQAEMDRQAAVDLSVKDQFVVGPLYSFESQFGGQGRGVEKNMILPVPSSQTAQLIASRDRMTVDQSLTAYETLRSDGDGGSLLLQLDYLLKASFNGDEWFGARQVIKEFMLDFSIVQLQPAFFERWLNGPAGLSDDITAYVPLLVVKGVDVKIQFEYRKTDTTQDRVLIHMNYDGRMVPRAFSNTEHTPTDREEWDSNCLHVSENEFDRFYFRVNIPRSLEVEASDDVMENAFADTNEYTCIKVIETVFADAQASRVDGSKSIMTNKITIFDSRDETYEKYIESAFATIRPSPNKAVGQMTAYGDSTISNLKVSFYEE